jgi:hypothetical protein
MATPQGKSRDVAPTSVVERGTSGTHDHTANAKGNGFTCVSFSLRSGNGSGEWPLSGPSERHRDFAGGPIETLFFLQARLPFSLFSLGLASG